MERNVLSRMRPIPSRYQLDIACSIGPFLTFLRFFGIDLDVNQPRSKFRRFIFLVFGTSVFVFMITVACFAFVYHLPLEQPRTSKFWFLVIEMDLWVCFTVFSQLAVFTMAYLRWKSLWNCAEKLEQFAKIPDNLLRRVRTSSITCTVVIFVIVNYFILK